MQTIDLASNGGLDLALLSLNFPFRVTESSTGFESTRAHKCSMQNVSLLSHFSLKSHFVISCFKLGEARVECRLALP